MNAAMPNGRCRLHGGKAYQKKGNRNAVKHGIYCDGLSEEEKALHDQLKVDELDDEIRLCKIRIRRALIARRKVEDNPDDLNEGFELTEVKQFQRSTQIGSDGKEVQQTRRELSRKRPDFEGIIDRYLGRLGSLMRTRAEILGQSGKDPATVAAEFQEAIQEMEASVRNGDTEDE